MLKVEGNRVYTTNRLPAIDVNAMPLFYMLNGSDSLLNSIKTLTTNIPAQLLMTKTETVGTMVADAGHLYVEVRKGGISQHWFIEANAPGYLTNFTALVRGVLWKVAN